MVPRAAEDPKSPDPKPAGFLQRLRTRLNRGSSWLAYDLGELFAGRQIDAAILEELETRLITADVGVAATERILGDLRQRVAEHAEVVVLEEHRERHEPEHAQVRRRPGTAPATVADLPNDAMSPLFQAVAEATEEAIYNSLFKATTVTGRSMTVEALPIDRTLEVLRRYNALNQDRTLPPGRP